MLKKDSCMVTIQPISLVRSVPYGTKLHTVIEAVANTLPPKDFQIFTYNSPCGGKGTCGKCKVAILKGELSSPGKEEQQYLSEQDILNGMRLACYVYVENDLVIELQKHNERAAIQTDYSVTELSVSDPDKECPGSDFSITPLMSKDYLLLPVPTLQDQRDLESRILETFQKTFSTSEKLTFSISDLQHLGTALQTFRLEEQSAKNSKLFRDETDSAFSVLKQEDSVIPVVLSRIGNTVIDITISEKIHDNTQDYGIAVDIGTTTIAVYLLDLKNGKQLDVTAALNAQKIAGADVISRISYAIEHEKGTQYLQRILVSQIQEMGMQLAQSHSINNEYITSCTIVGNTTMMHFLLGVNPISISRFPYIPVFTNSQLIAAKKKHSPEHKQQDIGLFSKLPNCSVYTLPCVSAYIGSDIIAGLVSADMDVSEELILFIDIGTNGEMVLGNAQGFTGCATAAGPAFEGASLTCGSGGVTGAVDAVWLENDTLAFSTLYNEPAKTICGSGIVDAIALLLQLGLIDQKGKFLPMEQIPKDTPSEIKSRRLKLGKEEIFLIASEQTHQNTIVYITQKDIREIQLAKAAIAAGICALVSELNIQYKDISKLAIAGGFGNKLNKNSALLVGLFPQELADSVVMLGNSAGKGAVEALCNASFRKRCNAIREKCKIVELSARSTFKKDLMKHMYFQYSLEESHGEKTFNGELLLPKRRSRDKQQAVQSVLEKAY